MSFADWRIARQQAHNPTSSLSTSGRLMQSMPSMQAEKSALSSPVIEDIPDELDLKPAGSIVAAQDQNNDDVEHRSPRLA